MAIVCVSQLSDALPRWSSMSPKSDCCSIWAVVQATHCHIVLMQSFVAKQQKKINFLLLLSLTVCLAYTFSTRLLQRPYPELLSEALAEGKAFSRKPMLGGPVKCQPLYSKTLCKEREVWGMYKCDGHGETKGLINPPPR